ncbi:Transposase [Streptomyces sp. TLI_053]|nr:Transposase [Streptomyces sp. TLI_053]
MRSDLISDELWEQVAPLMPPVRGGRGRPRVPNRTALGGIMYVLRTGVAWRQVPVATVGCAGVTSWRRLREWVEIGIWPRLHLLLLAELMAELREADPLDLDERVAHVDILKGGRVSPSGMEGQPNVTDVKWRTGIRRTS